MSTIGDVQDNSVVDSIFDDLEYSDIKELNDGEKALQQSLLDACLLIDNPSKQREQEQQLTSSMETVYDKRQASINNSLKKNEQEKEGVEHLNGIKTKSQDVAQGSQQSIKMEFSCSPERYVEPNMDYTLDDVIEISSIAGEDDEDSVDDVVSTILNEQKSNHILKENTLDDNDDNEDLLTVLNDHNYTTPETVAPTVDTNQGLRQNLIDHIVKKRSMDCNNSGNCDDDALSDSSNDSAIEEDAKKEIENFVDQILEGNIEAFAGKNDTEKRNVHVKQEFHCEAVDHTEAFVQNVIYAVADEDAAAYAAEKSFTHQKQKDTAIEVVDRDKRSCVNLESTQKKQVDHQSDDETEVCSFKWITSPHTERTVSKDHMAKSEKNQQEGQLRIPIRMDTTDNESGKQSSSTSVADSTSQLGSNVTLPDYCSEPLEIIPFEERFEQCEKDMKEIEIPFEERFNQLEKAMECNDALFLDNCVEQLENHQEQHDHSTENHIEQLGESIVGNQSVDQQKDLTQGVETVESDITLKQNEKVLQDSKDKGGKLEIISQVIHNSSKDNTPMSENSEEHELTNDNQNEVPHTLDADFQRLEKTMEEAETSISTSPLFREFNALVNEMHKDCATFSMATSNIDSRLRTYILEKIEIMQSLVRRCHNITGSVECASQTDPDLFRNDLRKLNKKDKRALLASTDSSSDSSSDNCDGNTSSSNDEMDKRDRRVRKSKRSKIDNYSVENIDTNNREKIMDGEETVIESIARSQLSQSSTLNSEYVYDDGVTLTKYLRSDVFSATSEKQENEKTSASSTSSRSQSPSTSLSEEDTSNQHLSSSVQDKVKKKSNKDKALDENDKEIERLINLDGLMKRHNNAGTPKQVDIDKLKTKNQNQKNKTDGVLDFLENDLPKELLSSEESANEDQEEVITEKQYLERYNQALRNQLLNESSNDTSEGEEADDEFAPALSDESESGNRSPLVDKFLKTYNIEESEEEDIELSNEGASVEEALETSPKTDETKKVVDEVISKKEENSKRKTENISENSDCELLNDSFICRKRTPSKSLEKILSEAEKRKKIQKLDEELISLSSESDCSDVEAVEIEPTESAKSRAIKPMLRPDQLQRETLKAQKSETDRIRRLEKRQAMLTKVLTENKEIPNDEELVLDYNEETKTFIKVHPGLVKHLKPHQRDGVRFMYDSCYGGVDSAKKNHGSGCILAHCMGLGKTLQLIALMHTVISYKELKTNKVLVLCPKSTVMNWGDEIIRWLHPLRTKNFKVFTFSDTSDINEKISVMREWSLSHYQKAGCLLIGYEAFRTLVFYHKYKIRNNLDSSRLEKIRSLIDEYLLQPGADLVVCDEGHIIKNSKSAISLAVAEIKTQKRIVLTGTPIQNNLKEYYSMVNFIKPLFLGTEKEFANLYANPIKNGQHKDSSKRDIKVMKQRSFVLHKKLSKFVQRKEAELLKSFLPKKFEYVLFIPMTNVQNKLYERILETITSRQDHRGRSLITDYTCLRKIWTHPKVLEDAWKNAVNQQFKRDTRKQPNSDDDQPDDIYDSQTGFMSVKNDWWRNFIAEKDLESILPSNKLRTMFEILRMCEENGDKCLIFSAFVAVLNVVEYFFKKLAQGDQETMNELNMPPGVRSTWEPNKDYFRLDGKTSKSTRHEMIKRFNQPHNTRSRVFLISAKAGGQGINLIGANRVIILDTSWNPSNDQQNIFRIFRLGQKKNCYIYRLLALGTMEEKVYSRSVTKQAMSFRVMDVQQIDRHYSMAELAELYTLTIPNYSERPTPVLPQDTILANLLRSFPDLVYKYHEHDSLLENKVEQELSEQEKIDAWNAYENDLQMNSQMSNMEDMQNKLAQGNFQNYMGSSGSIPGLNLQALLNFRGLNAPPNSSYMNPSLLQQYKYNMANQQYLDLVNNYRQYSSSDNAAAFNASVAAAYSSINSGIYPGVAPSVSPQHSGNTNISANTTAHPLSALNDLSMFGLGMGSSTSAAAAAAAAATSLSPLPSTSTNASSLYATPNVTPTPSVSAAGLYSNTVAAYYQSLQQLGYVGSTAPNSNMLNNAALSSFTNSTSFQTPKRTSPQTAARKSSTPDLASYRSSGGSISMTTVTTPTLTMPISTTSMSSMSTKQNEQPKLSSNNNPSSSNANTYNSKSEAANSSSKRNDSSSSRSLNKPSATSTNSAMNVTNVMTLARSETSTTISQNRSTPTPTSVATVTSTSKPLTTTTHVNSRSASKSHTGAISSTPTTKTVDPQIRVKDMGQLCANSSRGSSSQVPAPTASAGRDILANTVSNNNKSISSNNSGRSKQSTMDMITTTTPATAAELLKKRSEMQIIPTTSPPGTASISKQLSEISPSISLTAVRNTNAKPNSTNTPNFNKVSGVSPSTTNNSKPSRVNSPANIPSSLLTNRQLTTSTGLQQRKNANNSSTVVLGNTTNIKKATAASVAATTTTAMPSIQSRKTVVSVPQSSLTVTTVPSSSLNTNSNVVAKVSNNNNSSNNTKYGYPQTGARTNMATITPSTTKITNPGKNMPNILRNHHIRKMPSPLPTTLGSGTTNNINTKAISNVSSNINQLSSPVNAKPTFVSSTKSNTTSTVTVANAAQLMYTNKNTTSGRRSFSPTATATQRTSRTASPANVSTAVVEKLVSHSGVVGTANRLKTTTVGTPTAAPTTTSAFPVHLQRSNSALGTMRNSSPLNVVKATTVSGLGNRTKSTTAIVTPKIASVASLNNTTISPVTSSSATTAARAAALKKISSSTGKTNMKSIKQLQSTSLPALKAAAATSVMQQKRISTSGGVSSAPQQQQQQQQQSSKRITIQANGKSLNVGINPQNITRILPGDTVIGGVNMRTIFKGSSTGPSNASPLNIGEKRLQSGVQTNSANGQPSSKLLTERKRKASDLLYKESGNLIKRPKES